MFQLFSGCTASDTLNEDYIDINLANKIPNKDFPKFLQSCYQGAAFQLTMKFDGITTFLEFDEARRSDAKFMNYILTTEVSYTSNITFDTDTSFPQTVSLMYSQHWRKKSALWVIFLPKKLKIHKIWQFIGNDHNFSKIVARSGKIEFLWSPTRNHQISILMRWFKNRRSSLILHFDIRDIFWRNQLGKMSSQQWKHFQQITLRIFFGTVFFKK